MNKFLETTQAFIAVITLIGLASVSVFTVSKLNPKVSSDSGNVAGELDELINLSSINPLIVRNKIDDPITYSIIESEGKSVFRFSFDSLQEKNNFKFLEVENNNPINSSINIQTSVPASLENVLDIRLSDNLDEVILYSPNYKNVNRSLTVLSSSSRRLSLSVEGLEAISFPFSIEIKVSAN